MVAMLPVTLHGRGGNSAGARKILGPLRARQQDRKKSRLPQDTMRCCVQRCLARVPLACV
eukprot:444895-Prymnesium_polylepis.1